MLIKAVQEANCLRPKLLSAENMADAPLMGSPSPTTQHKPIGTGRRMAHRMYMVAL